VQVNLYDFYNFQGNKLIFENTKKSSITTSLFNSIKPVKENLKDLRKLDKANSSTQDEYHMKSSLSYIFQAKQDFKEFLN
jgi:hypothetical protein